MGDTSNVKEVRYDRQLRLWGDHGQQALESARVALIGSCGTGTEILKSLVLPGVGNFTIIDGASVTPEDLGSNFFLDESCVGKDRAQCVCELLQELNPDVRGTWIKETPEQLLKNNLTMLTAFNLVIVNRLAHKTMMELGAFLWNHDIPLIICRSYGLMGYLRVVCHEHIVLDGHPDNPFPDFRLEAPFPPLLELADKYDFGKLTHQEHSHVPYLIILLKCLQEWQHNLGENGLTPSVANGPLRVPSSYAEKKAFKQLVLSHRMPDDKGSLEEENFEEAVRAINTAFGGVHIFSAAAQILSSAGDSAAELNQARMDKPSLHAKFYLLSSALKRFAAEKGHLPLRGSLPDMIASSERYVELQNVYRTRALREAEEMFNLAKELEGGLEGPARPNSPLQLDETRQFCKNINSVQICEGRSLAQEYAVKNECLASLVPQLESNTCLLLYVLMRAADRFFVEMNRFPGTNGIPVDLDKNDLLVRVERFLSDEGMAGGRELSESQLAYVEEMCRYGAAELHTTAAFIGGIGAQEAIKLITSQYVPINNTFVFNGITGESDCFLL